MSLQNRLEALKAKKAALEVKIEEENLRPSPDEILIADLKRKKLRLKEEIQEMNAAT